MSGRWARFPNKIKGPWHWIPEGNPVSVCRALTEQPGLISHMNHDSKQNCGHCMKFHCSAYPELHSEATLKEYDKQTVGEYLRCYAKR